MKVKHIIITIYIIVITIIFAGNSLIFAANPPTLQEPANDSTTSDTSPKLVWQYSDSCTSDGSCFLVQVDEADSFADPQRSTYTNNSDYSPNLATGKWYWRVKAKDSTNTWSEYSEVRSFTISNPEPTPTPSSSPTPSPTPDNSLGSFVITGTPPNVNSNASFNALVQLAKLSPNATYYIKGAFYKDGSTNYFGKTLVSGSWVKNITSATAQFKITTDGSGNWAGSLEVMPDGLDSGFTGSGDYQFKVAKYNSAGSDLSWSNDVSIHINYIPEPIPTGAPQPDKTTKPTSQPSSSSKANSSPTKASILRSGSIFPGIASISGITSSSSAIDDNLVLENSFTESKNYINWWLIGGGVLALIGSSYPFIKITTLKTKLLNLRILLFGVFNKINRQGIKQFCQQFSPYK